MATIEERAKKSLAMHHEESFKIFNQEHRNMRGWEYGYCQGATEQKQIDIDNACEWIRNNWRDYLFRDKDGMSCFAHWENDFRKAMEG